MTRHRQWRRRRHRPAGAWAEGSQQQQQQGNGEAGAPEPGSGAVPTEGGPSDGAPMQASGAENPGAPKPAFAGGEPTPGGSNGSSNQKHRRRRHRRRHRGQGPLQQPLAAPPQDGSEPAAAPDGSTAGLPSFETNDAPGGFHKMKRRRRRRHRHQPGRGQPQGGAGHDAAQDEGADTRARGRFVGNWWADRWIKMLESLGHSNRLPRGRYYARTGRVFDFRVGPGEVTAKVQGSRPQPYSVRIEVAPLDERAWSRVVEAMASRAVFAAKMLSGEMPQNIGEVFASASVSLFPKLARDIRVNCSCPDSANLCKHAVAVHYILAEAFDQDPFILLHLRGRSRDEVIDALTRTRAKLLATESPPPPVEGQAPGTTPAAQTPQEDEGPPASDPFRFYELGHGLEDLTFILEPPEVPNAVLTQLGPPPTHNPDQAGAALAGCYALVSQHALDAAFARETDERLELPVPAPVPSKLANTAPAITSTQVSLKSIRG